MRRFLIGWILIVLLLPFAAAWIYSEWSEKNQQIEQESSQLQIDVQTVSGVQRMGLQIFSSVLLQARYRRSFRWRR